MSIAVTRTGLKIGMSFPLVLRGVEIPGTVLWDFDPSNGMELLLDSMSVRPLEVEVSPHHSGKTIQLSRLVNPDGTIDYAIEARHASSLVANGSARYCACRAVIMTTAEYEVKVLDNLVFDPRVLSFNGQWYDTDSVLIAQESPDYIVARIDTCRVDPYAVCVAVAADPSADHSALANSAMQTRSIYPILY